MKRFCKDILIVIVVIALIGIYIIKGGTFIVPLTLFLCKISVGLSLLLCVLTIFTGGNLPTTGRRS